MHQNGNNDSKFNMIKKHTVYMYISLEGIQVVQTLHVAKAVLKYDLKCIKSWCTADIWKVRSR